MWCPLPAKRTVEAKVCKELFPGLQKKDTTIAPIARGCDCGCPCNVYGVSFAENTVRQAIKEIEEK